MGGFAYPSYPYRASPDRRAASPARYKVVVVGAGMVGLTAGIDLALRGIPVVLIDDDDTVSVGSRSICQAKRTLEIWDRLGCAAPMMEKGITWQTGKIHFGDAVVYGFDLLPEGGHQFPAFINLQQYHVEKFLVDRALSLPAIDLRWKNRLVGLEPASDGVRLRVETPDGLYEMEADWVVAADGARSQVRRLLGLEFRGKVFEDHFLIADVRMKADFPVERRFWFAPSFHPEGSALLHKQADDVWRIDFQLGRHVDPEAEKRPGRVATRLSAMLGPEARYDFEWISVYTFQCRRLERFRHGRVVFAGDAAHQVSPFGARGGNSGAQDADNLAWKLALVVKGLAPERLLDSYDAERVPAADENLLASTRSTDFISPQGAASLNFRNATLRLARDFPFARRLVNSGRLSVAAALADSPLNTADEDPFDCPLRPGGVAPDAPIVVASRPAWLLHAMDRGSFVLLYFPQNAREPWQERRAAWRELAGAPISVHTLVVVPASDLAALPALEPAFPIDDAEGLIVRRYDGRPGTCYLLRPDHHVCARWRRFDLPAVAAALRRATRHDVG